MSLTRLCSRLAKVEAQRRPAHVAAVLQRVRQCAPSELGMVLYTQITAVDRVTARAIMDQLTEAELGALVPPEMQAFIDTLSDAELEALGSGDPRTLQRVHRAFMRWRQSRP